MRSRWLWVPAVLFACGPRPGAATPTSNQVDEAPEPPSLEGKIFVSVGDMTTSARAGVPLARMVHDAVVEELGRDDTFLTEWPEGATNTAAVPSFHVDGTLTVTIKQAGAAVRIKCKLDLLIATYPEKSMFGFWNGSAEVGATTVQADIDLGVSDCATALVEDVIGRKAIPMLRERAGAPP